MPTPDIFDFEPTSGYDQDAVDRLLVEQPALYLNHLRVALALSQWSSRMAEHGGGLSEDYRRGYAQALREVAAHLRQGDYVEDGEMIRQIEKVLEQ